MHKVSSLAAIFGWYGLAVLALLLTTPSAPNSHQGVTSTTPEVVSLLQILANPRVWHGRRVRLAGFVNLEFEGDALYLSREDFDQALYPNSLWINVPDILVGPNHPDTHRGYAMIEGTINSDDHGHMGLWPASLDSITAFVPLLSRSEMESRLRGYWPPVSRR
jgi:hypothetical protein